MLKGFRDFILRGNVVDLAVAVIIGARQKADVREITPTNVAGHIQKNPLPLEAAQVMALLKDLPRRIHPELSQRLIHPARSAHLGHAVRRL